ncbi:hypothetical protein, partial [Qipengyuania sp. YIM B01966]|uniref:hypothetical protein n=1 Tax=Qipengyuania sp. YIM B01966 TaxID=2778646 RepID=UPI001F30D2FE
MGTLALLVLENAAPILDVSVLLLQLTASIASDCVIATMVPPASSTHDAALCYYIVGSLLFL